MAILLRYTFLLRLPIETLLPEDQEIALFLSLIHAFVGRHCGYL